jgi:predicted Zn-dependent protease
VSSPPPTQDELLSLAERALAFAGGEAQATARWRREVDDAVRVGTVVEIAVVVDGRAGLATTADLDADGLRRAARRAAETAQPVPGARLGDPAPGRAHDGYDPATLALEPAAGIRAVAEKVAIASTRGVRAFEQWTAVEARVRREAPGRSLEVTEAAVGPAGVDLARLAAEAGALFGDGPTGDPTDDVLPVVLTPWAVAGMLQRLAPAFSGARADDGPLAGRLGTRIVAPAINLSDSPRFPATLPRSYDAEGVPRQPLPLIQDGVAHRVVHDATSAHRAGTTSTGHARLPAGLAAPAPAHLVLVGGGAADVDELAAPLERGVLIGSLGQGEAQGVRLIVDGRTGTPLPDRTVDIDPLAVLASVQALTSRQRTIAAGRDGATVAPGLRATAGIAPS